MSVAINEEGPREGFQIEKGPIATARKVELIDALSDTGVKQIQIVSFVSPQAVPGMADAEEVVRDFNPKPGVRYTSLWLNDRGFERALACRRLDARGTVGVCLIVGLGRCCGVGGGVWSRAPSDASGSITLTASETFLKRNQRR